MRAAGRAVLGQDASCGSAFGGFLDLVLGLGSAPFPGCCGLLFHFRVQRSMGIVWMVGLGLRMCLKRQVDNCFGWVVTGGGG